MKPAFYNSIYMVARASGFAPAIEKGRLNPGQESIEANLVLAPGSWLKGTVVDTNERGISGVQPYISSSIGHFQLFAESPITGPDGSFHLKDMPPLNQLLFRKRGYNHKRVKDPEMNREDLVVVMSGAGHIRGRVINGRNGKAVEEFTVKVHRSKFLDRGLWAHGGIHFSAPDGSFSIEDLYPSTRLLVIEAACCPTGYFDNVPVEENPPVMDFELGLDNVRLAGVIQDGEGSPRPNIPIVLLLYDPDNFVPEKIDLDQIRAGYTGNWLLEHRVAVSDQAGFFHFDTVASNRQVDLVVASPGLAKTRLSRVFDLPEPEWEQLDFVVRDGGSIIIQVNRETYATGALIVTNLNGKADKMVRVLAENQNPIIFSELTADLYQLELRDSEDKMLQVLESEKILITEGETVELRLGDEKLYRVSGTALAGRTPAGNRALAMFQQYGSLEWTRHGTTDTDGAFYFDKIKADEYTLVLGGSADEGLTPSPRSLPNRRDLTVNADVEGVFVFQDYANVSGRLISKNYRNLELGELTVNLNHRRYIAAPPDGYFSIPGVSPGTYYLKGLLRNGGQNIFAKSFAVPEGGNDVDLGDVDERAGQVLLHFEGGGDTSNCTLTVDLFNSEWNADLYGKAENTRYNLPYGQKALLQDVPPGETTVIPRFLACPIGFIPQSQTVNLRRSGNAELHFQIAPVTYLEISVIGTNHILADVRLRNDVGVFELPQIRRGDPLPLIDRVSAGFWERQARVRGLPAGPWTFQVTSNQGKKLSVSVILQRGEKLKHSVNFGD